MNPMKEVQINELGDTEQYGTEIIVLKASDKKDRWIVCSSCCQETWHEVIEGICNHEKTGAYESWNNFLVIKCRGCETLCFLKEYSLLTDDFSADEQGRIIDGFKRSQTVYPGRLSGMPKMKHLEVLPSVVRSIYEETYGALCDEQPILAGAGIRAIIESICIQQKASKRTLSEKIDELVEQRLITSRAAKHLHGLRFMGNNALHETKAHELIELCTAMNIAEHMMNEVYIIPDKAKTLSSGNSPVLSS